MKEGAGRGGLLFELALFEWLGTMLPDIGHNGGYVGARGRART
jgi:hypothetical protein